jgi:hypothetical protein
MAVAFLDSGKGFAGDPNILLLVPVSDYKAFLSNWPGAQADGEITQVTLGDNKAQAAYAANWGQYAAISPTKEAVSAKPASGLNLPSTTAKELAAKDAIFYINIAAMRPLILPQFQQGRDLMMAEMDRSLRQEPAIAKMGPFIKALMTQVFSFGEAFINETQGASIGMALVPEGINTTMMAEFEPGSNLAQTISSLKNTDAPLLEGLPAAKYMFYGGAISDPQVNSKIIGDIVDPMLKELLAIGPEMAPAQDYVDAVKAMAGATKGQSFGLVAPGGMLGAEPILQGIAIYNGDPKIIGDALRKAGEAETKLMEALNMPGASGMKPTFTPNAKSIDGVDFNSMTIKPEMNAQDPIAMQQAQIMSMIYGSQGAVVLSGAVGDHLLLCTGVPDALISQAIASTKTDATPLALTDGVKAVSAQLPKQRIGVMYWDVGTTVTTALTYAKNFGLRIPVQLPPELPPVGIAVGTDGNAVRIDSHVSTMMLQSLIAGAMQAQMQMNGGAPGGAL